MCRGLGSGSVRCGWPHTDEVKFEFGYVVTPSATGSVHVQCVYVYVYSQCMAFITFGS